MPVEIVWTKKLAQALEKARAEDKLVLAAFFSQNCEPCNRLKNHTLCDESVLTYLSKYFVPLKYESGMDSEQFLRFDIRAMPTILVLDADCNELFRKIGYYAPDIFIENLEQARGKKSPQLIMRIQRID